MTIQTMRAVSETSIQISCRSSPFGKDELTPNKNLPSLQNSSQGILRQGQLVAQPFVIVAKHGIRYTNRTMKGWSNFARTLEKCSYSHPIVVSSFENSALQEIGFAFAQSF